LRCRNDRTIVTTRPSILTMCARRRFIRCQSMFWYSLMRRSTSLFDISRSTFAGTRADHRLIALTRATISQGQPIREDLRHCRASSSASDATPQDARRGLPIRARIDPPVRAANSSRKQLRPSAFVEVACSKRRARLIRGGAATSRSEAASRRPNPRLAQGKTQKNIGPFREEGADVLSVFGSG
jgi:hypothetical protein